jgi:hypothetical protein
MSFLMLLGEFKWPALVRSAWKLAWAKGRRRTFPRGPATSPILAMGRAVFPADVPALVSAMIEDG